jgi:hypothetical protein
VTTRTLAPSDVFINVPFDTRYEALFLALIAGLVSLGLNPRSVVQIGASTDRLRRLVEIITLPVRSNGSCSQQWHWSRSGK